MDILNATGRALRHEIVTKIFPLLEKIFINLPLFGCIGPSLWLTGLVAPPRSMWDLNVLTRS